MEKLSIMSGEEFNNLLEKYLKRQCTAEEERVVDQWYEALSNTAVDYTEEDDRKVEIKLWETIERRAYRVHEFPAKQVVPSKRLICNRALIGIAASVLLIVLAGIYILIPSLSPEHPITTVQTAEKEVGTITIKNTDGLIVKPVRLEDGSLVVLQPNSEIQYDQPFAADQREVTLSGEAFFEITKNVNHPFLVHSHGLVTKVLGTSFNIKAIPAAKTIVVDVKTGKVAVYKENDTASINTSSSIEEYILIPNQQAVYDRNADKILQQLQENPQIIVTEKEINEMKFDDAPAVEVFEALEKAYGVDLVYDENVFLNCSLTTCLSNEGLYKKLQIICRALGATYETKETKVLIQGKGCG